MRIVRLGAILGGALLLLAIFAFRAPHRVLGDNPTPVDVTFTTLDKLYDGNASAAVDQTADPVCVIVQNTEPDDVTCVVDQNATATFDSKNVGTDKTVTGDLLNDPSGFSLAGADATKYTIASATSTANISALHVTGSFTADNKTYDGGTSATVLTRSPGAVITNDAVSLAGGTATFDTRNVGNGKTVTLTGAGLTGNDAGNYILDSVSTTTANISALHVTGSFTADNKTYDGGTSATVLTRSPGAVITNDAVSLAGGTATFDTRNVGNGKTVTLTGAGLTGNDAGNYILDSVSTTTANISQKRLDVYAASDTRTYNGTTSSSGTPTFAAGDIQAGDTQPIPTQSFDSRNAGPRTLSVTPFAVSDGNSGLNYDVHLHTAAGTINQATMIVNAVNNVKTADGTTSAAGIPTTPSTVYPGDSTTGRFSETYDTAAAGSNKTLTPAGTVNDGNSGLNYAYTYNTFTTGRIRPNVVASIAFTAQPIDTKTGTPILSTCAPGGNPCGASSAPVQVTALDQYGNLAGPGAPGADNTNASITVTIRKDNVAGSSLGSAQTSAGIASFGTSLVIPGTFLGRTNLYGATGSLNAASTFFRIVNDLAPCNAAVCKNNVGNGGNANTLQYLYGQINSGSSYTATTLTTQFVGANQIDGRCGSNRTINVGVELRAAGTDANTTSNSYMLMIIPKSTLKYTGVLSRGTPSFMVCLGTLYLGNGTLGSYGSQYTPWNTISGLAREQQDSLALDQDTFWRYWGIPANCGARGLTPSDPCIYLRTKQKSDITALVRQGILTAGADANMNDADLAVVIKKPRPWDGKGGLNL